MAGAISIIDKNYNLTKFYTILLEYFAVNKHIYHPNVAQFIMRTLVIAIIVAFFFAVLDTLFLPQNLCTKISVIISTTE